MWRALKKYKAPPPEAKAEIGLHFQDLGFEIIVLFLAVDVNVQSLSLFSLAFDFGDVRVPIGVVFESEEDGPNRSSIALDDGFDLHAIRFCKGLGLNDIRRKYQQTQGKDGFRGKGSNHAKNAGLGRIVRIARKSKVNSAKQVASSP